MNGVRICFRSRYIAVCLILVTVFSCCTLTAAAAPTSEDGIISGLLSGWSSSSSPLYYNTSWFWQVLVELRDIDTTLSGTFSDLKSGWSGTSLTTPTGYTNSWYASVRNLLYGIDGSLDLIQPAVTNIDLDLDTIELKTSSVENYISNYLPGLSSNIGFIKTYTQNAADYLLTVKNEVSSLDTRAEEAVLHLGVLSREFPLLNAYASNIADDTSNIAVLTYHIAMDTDSIKSDTEFMQQDLEDLKQFFVSPEDQALKDRTAQSLLDASSSLPDTSSFSRGLFGVKDFFSLGEFGEVEVSFSDFNDSISLYEFWFSAETASSLEVGAGSAALFGFSNYSRYVPPDTPLVEENIKNVIERVMK